MSYAAIPLHGLPPQGQSILVDDPGVWMRPLAEFGVDCRVVEPLRAEVFLLPQARGCLLRGRIGGKVELPCDRCAESALVVLEHDFEEFLEADLTPGDGECAPPPENGIIRRENDALVVDVAALLWEEFSLALPVKPLCSPDCRGICPNCGKNLNNGPCSCSSAGADPRFASLRHGKT
jgi:uncharacterized protein